MTNRKFWLRGGGEKSRLFLQCCEERAVTRIDCLNKSIVPAAAFLQRFYNIGEGSKKEQACVGFLEPDYSNKTKHAGSSTEKLPSCEEGKFHRPF
ncbi:hypothetical protein GN956_G12219 [Arapaima gigas]